jgi:hypothetical protein
MITLPTYITLEDYDTFLQNLYPPHDITVYDDDYEDEDATDALRNSLIYTAYYELFLVYDLNAAPNDNVINSVFHHACHIWRSEGARSARLDLISQTVTEAGVVKEKYDKDGLPFSPIIKELLKNYKRTVALKLVEKVRDMENTSPYDGIAFYNSNLLIG